ncbi:MAG: hypothetical protein IT385_15910 [Deltaproteobacteria bacterium]|nr:hypothetical protein [Deltaproteobacteria bacterium]
MSAPVLSSAPPGRRLGQGASLYLALVWTAAPLILIFWVLPPAEGEAGTDAAARYTFAQRIGPLLVAIGEAARAAAAMMQLAAGDARQRILAHTGVVVVAAMVGLAIAPGPWLGLLALAGLCVRQAAAAQALREPLAGVAAVACLAFGVAAELGGATPIVITVAALGGLTALAEVLHLVRRAPAPEASSLTPKGS